MPARITTTTKLRVVLDAASPSAPLGAEILAAAAGIPVAEARARLSVAPSDLVAALVPREARRLVALLAVYGLRVRAEAADAPRQRAPVRFDMALQWARPDDEGKPLAELARRLNWAPAAAALAIGSAAGLVLRDLDRAALGLCRRALSGLPGLRTVVSDPEVAQYDLMPGEATEGRAEAALVRHLRRLGVAGCPLTGAVGAGLDRVMRDHVARRFPGAGTITVNRDFQRFDLLLTGTNGVSAGELAGFLRARGGPLAADGVTPDAARPLRIECALGRADALAFQSDYAAIGLETRLRLVWPEVAQAA